MVGRAEWSGSGEVYGKTSPGTDTPEVVHRWFCTNNYRSKGSHRGQGYFQTNNSKLAYSMCIKIAAKDSQGRKWSS